LEKGGKGGFEKKMFFLIKSPLTPLYQRGEIREGLYQRGEIREGLCQRGEIREGGGSQNF